MPLHDPKSWFYTLLRVAPLPRGLHWLAANAVNTRFLAGVAGIVRDERNQLLLFSHTYRPIAWGLPGGWMRPGESPLETLEREVREESGLEVKAQRLLLVGHAPDRPRLEFVVEAQWVGGTFRPSHEVRAMQWCAPDQTPHLARIHRQILAQVGDLDPCEVGWYLVPWNADREKRRTNGEKR